MTTKAALLRAFPDGYRQSMTLYADELTTSLRSTPNSNLSILDYHPKRAILTPALLRYGSQYLDYQAQVFFIKADVFHILDQSYAHLIHTMDPKKTLITVHDMIGFEHQQLTQRWNLSAFQKAGRIICPSEATRKHFLSRVRYPEDKIRIIHLGVDKIFSSAGNKEEAKNKLGLSQDFHILHVGHTNTYKNIPALFHVMAHLKRQGRSQVKLLKSGMPFTSEQIKLAGSLGILGDIIHRGITDRASMPDLYRAADLLLFPSLNEGFGFPVLEAFASGLPVIASNRGSLPEIAGDAALLCGPEDYTAMTSHVLSVMEDPARREQLIQAGFKQVRHFSWEETARKTLAVYKETASEAKS